MDLYVHTLKELKCHYDISFSLGKSLPESQKWRNKVNTLKGNLKKLYLLVI